MSIFSKVRRRHASRIVYSQLKDVELRPSHRGESRSRSCAGKMVALVLGACFLSVFLAFSARVILENANRLGRQCGSLDRSRLQLGRLTFALVSCSDGLSTVPDRSFEGILDLVSPNKRKYASQHGYAYIDASSLLDRERPPSWSKIKAVREYLGSYDWVFWNDADSLVTNFSITLEDVLGSCLGDGTAIPDMIITEDVTGVNAGMFFIRDTPWSRSFLDLWWNQTSFVKPFGSSKSGDNDALKFLLSRMPAAEKRHHIFIPRMQCLFNSYLWIPSLKSAFRLLTLTRTVWQGAYSHGDFMVHLAGIDNKKDWLKCLNFDKSNS